MPSPVVLKVVNRRLAELTRQYTAIRKGDPRALAIAEELSQIGTVRDEIQRIQEKLGCSGQPPKSSPSGRSEIVNEITRLTFLADSLFKSKNSHITGAQCERSGNGAEEGVELDFD
jgi:hypothetical protein